MLKPIKDFPRYYASDDGKIYSNRSGRLFELKQYCKSSGYMYVALYENKQRYYCRVHRLIAQTFLNNPQNLPEVNHKDENKQNNAVSNLEWCSHSYNLKHGTRRERVARKVSDPTVHRKNNTSGRKGVVRTKWGTYHAYMNRKGLGTFKTFDDAVKARERAEQKFLI